MQQQHLRAFVQRDRLPHAGLQSLEMQIGAAELCLLCSADSVPTPLQGEKDWQKYETARRLKKCVDKIRNQYREDWKSKEMKVRQRAVALYFIDKVRLRPWHLPCPAGNTWECWVFVLKAELSPVTKVS